MALTNAYCCDTSPSLHIEAARIVGFPPGTPSAQFLIAYLALSEHLFIEILAFGWVLKKSLFILVN